MKFNFISINSNFWKHETKCEIKLSSAVDGFFHTDKFDKVLQFK